MLLLLLLLLLLLSLSLKIIFGVIEAGHFIGSEEQQVA